MNPETPPKSNAPAKTAPPAPAKVKATAKSDATPPPQPITPPLFRAIDWWTLGICFAIMWTVYFLTLAPELTLEDSGELATASYWAGIPHPPGYPFWTIYTWLWTVLVPFGNVAWRVALGEATAAAAACGLLAFMVSRGSSMLMESIEELKNMPAKWENAICMVAGLAAGLLMGFDGSMWKESVAINRISLFGVPWLMLVLLFMLRWIYAPHQKKYLYMAMFCFGICATIHQTLINATMAIEIGIAARHPKLGRDLFFANCVIFICVFMGVEAGAIHAFEDLTPMMFKIFNAIGLLSIAACVYLVIKTGGLLSEWKTLLIMIVMGILGVSFYFYEPLAGMTNPPMEWGYPRTVEGFFHALSRGQYEKINPTDIFQEPGKFLIQLKMLFLGVADAFNWVCMFFAALPFLFIWKMQKRERSWIILLGAIYPFLGVLLTIFLNPTRDRQMSDLVKVFFVAFHSTVAIMIGYGFALAAAYMATNYTKFRRWGLLCGAVVALPLALYNLVEVTGQHFLGLDAEISVNELPHWISKAFAPDQYGLPIYASLLLLALPIIFVISLLVYRKRAPLLITLGLFAAMPLYSAMSHWFHSEQRNHWFGYWFGHDMFTPPFVGPDGKLSYDAKLREQAMKGPNGKLVYPEMTRDAVLFGGTDPGRFCPTYMIFCDSFIPHSCQPDQDQNFDRRDVYIITQNALADNTYLDYIRAQYNRSLQIDPPFFQNFLPTKFPKFFHGPTPGLTLLDDVFESLGAKIERRRRTGSSWFQEADFTNVQDLAAKLRKGNDQDGLAKFLYGKLTPETQGLLDNKGDEKALRRDLAKDLNVVMDSGSIYDSDRFKNVKLPVLIQHALTESILPSTSIRLNRRMLEEAYPGDIAKSLGGVYPDTEIHTPTPLDSQNCFQEYLQDAQRRLEHDRQFPGERPQIKPGEDVVTKDGRVQVSGQVAVMAINGLLTKVIFDENPNQDFFVEESFPLDWMYPYLTPFGIIMKINRNPVPEITQEVIDRDHAFWSTYSERSIGNWITYDTSIKDVCDFCERAYLRHDYAGFKGDRKFTRDDDGQKSFSKLRSSIGASIYQWRQQNARNPAERERVTKEAEFALKQAFAFCPYSPEAVFHLMELVLNMNRVDDALYILRTCHKLDPYNTQITGWIEQLEKGKVGTTSTATVQQVLSQVQQQIQARRTNEAEQMLEQLLHYPQADSTLMMQVASFYLTIGNFAKAEEAVQRLVKLDPTTSANWYNLGLVQAHEGKMTESVASLKSAIKLNAAEMSSNPKAINLRDHVLKDPGFEQVRQTPEFKAAMDPALSAGGGQGSHYGAHLDIVLIRCPSGPGRLKLEPPTYCI